MSQDLFTPVGNTPTCVGKTSFAPLVALFFWKHPHVRGEDVNHPHKF